MPLFGHAQDITWGCPTIGRQRTREVSTGCWYSWASGYHCQSSATKTYLVLIGSSYVMPLAISFTDIKAGETNKAQWVTASQRPDPLKLGGGGSVLFAPAIILPRPSATLSRIFSSSFSCFSFADSLRADKRRQRCQRVRSTAPQAQSLSFLLNPPSAFSLRCWC